MKNILVLCSFSLIFANAQPVRLTISNAASYQQNTSIVPGTIIAVKGQNLTNAIAFPPDSTNPPTTLGGVQLSIGGVPCRLYYVSPSQINAQIDPSTPTGLQVANLQSPTVITQASLTIQPATSAGVFTLLGTGSGDGAIVNATTGNENAFSVLTAGGGTYLALFMTSLNIAPMPTVWVGGTSVPVQYFGAQGSYPGMQQINIQLPPQLQGTGRVEIVVEQSGHRSNAVEAVLLPNQPVFSNDQANQLRSRELASVAWIPGTSAALVADENDDVVRVIDLLQRRVTHVIALPGGARPVAIGVHGSGTLAIVAEKARGSIALLDLAKFQVINEFPTGLGASAIAVAGDEGVIANSDDDTVSFFNFRGLFNTPGAAVTATVAVGRLPRAVAVDSQHAYVTNQSAGTVSVLDLTNQAVVNTWSLGVDVRPGAIQVLPDMNLAVIAEPSAGPNGKLIFLKLATGQFVSVSANPDNTGGASSIVAHNDRIYLANQSGASVTTTNVAVLPDTQFLSTDIQVNPVNMKVDIGARALSLDSGDGWLLTAAEGDGMLTVTDIGNNNAIAHIDALRASTSDNTDDHSDRLAAPNQPAISSVSPVSANAAVTAVNTTLTILGTNLTNASQVLFLDPATVSSLAPGQGNVNRGNFGTNDPALSVTGIQASADGTKLTVQVQIAPSTSSRTRVVRVLTPNGETSLTNAPTFSIVPQM